MATAGYERGIGGKFRRRPNRRAAATPYDRPPAVARGLMGRTAEAGRNGWLSKLVDPASRFIASSASRIFSSVFGKRLALPEAPEGNRQSSQEVPEVACTLQNPSSKLLEHERNDGVEQMNNPDTSGIFELEELLKQKTFTRVEFDYLTQLLRSRTFEPDRSKPTTNKEEKEETVVSAQDNGVGGSKSLQDFSTPSKCLIIPEDEAASPADLAKAYMGSRSSKVTSSALSLQSQVFRGDKTMPRNALCISNPFDPSVIPKSVVRFSEAPGLPKNGFMPPKPRGRSAIYRMSCSPYFKVHPTTNMKGAGPSNNVSHGPSSSHQTLASTMHSGGKQVLKQGSSALDSDFGSVGPIQRIRQKSNMISFTKDICSKLPVNILPSPSTPPDKGFIQGSKSMQKTGGLDDQKHDNIDLQSSEKGSNRKSYENIASSPLQSSETARKILQQLDKLVPSPKQGSSEPNTFSRDESPSKSMHILLHGQVFENMKDIDSSKSLNEEGNDNLDAVGDSLLIDIRNTPQNPVKVEENSSKKSSVSGLKSALESNSADDALVRVIDSMPGNSSAHVGISGSAAFPSQKNPAFKMIAPEDSLELDDDNNSKDASGPVSTMVDNVLVILKHKDVTSEPATAARFLIDSSKYIPLPSSISAGEADMKGSVGPVVSGKSTGFTFPVGPAPSMHSQPPQKPAMPSPLLDRSASQKEHTASPFSFGSKVELTFTLSSTLSTTGFSETAGLKIGVSKDSSSVVDDNSKLNRSGEMQQSGDLIKSVGTAVSSVISTFGALTAPSLSNGSLHSSSNFSFSTSPAVTFSDGTVSSIFSTSPSSATGYNGSSISPIAPIFSTVPALQFGPGTSKGFPIPVSPSQDKSDNMDLVAKPTKASPFSTNSSAQGTFSFSGTGSSISSALIIPSAFSNTGSDSSVVATLCTSSSMGSSSTAPAPSMSTSQSVLAPSSAFRGAISISGFNASGQSGSLSPSVSVSNSQNFDANIGATAASFGSQSTQTGSWVSHFSQSSASPFGSSPSAPTFGLGTTTSGFGSSLFGNAPTGAKSFISCSGLSVSAGANLSSPGTSSSAATTSLFSLSSRPSTSSVCGTIFGSIASPSTGFSLGLSTSAPGSSFTFGSSSGSVFSFTSAPSTPSTPFFSAQAVFGMSTAAAGFSSGSTGSDQMNVEDSMADDINQAEVSMVSTFAQPSSSLAAPVFGASANLSGGSPIFQIDCHPDSSIPQNPSPFQAAGNLEFPPGGSFSLGSGGGDKSGRKFVKVRRDKLRKK